MMKNFWSLSFLILLAGCSGGSSTSSTTSANSPDVSAVTTSINALKAQAYTVVQGNAYLFVNADCPQFVSIFGSCFGNNAAAPYVIPQVPVENSYVDPYYAAPLNAPGPNGVTTNIVYRLSDNDALITVVKYPPKGAYFGYQSYVATSAKSNYSQSDPLQITSPDPARFEIFGSVGNDVNNIVVQNQNGSPWNGQVITYVTTSNQNLANDIVSKLVTNGVNRNSILIEKVGSNVRTGNDQSADDLITLIRYAIPQDSNSASAWYASISNNVLVYKVSAPTVSVNRYPVNQYTSRTGTIETQLAPALDELASLLEGWSTANTTLGSLSAVSNTSFSKTTVDDLNGQPRGLVGSDCIAKGTICAGDNQDTSTYAFSPKFALSSTSILFIAGVNHNKFNNSSYISIDVYNAAQAAGIASSSQTNDEAVGFSSGNLATSTQGISTAEIILRELGLYDSASTMLKLTLPSLYITLISNSCTVASKYCINLSGNFPDTNTPLLPVTTPPTPINIYERSYIRPGDTTAADTNIMIYPRVIGPGKEKI